jgi:hypothetical protein
MHQARIIGDDPVCVGEECKGVPERRFAAKVAYRTG